VLVLYLDLYSQNCGNHLKNKKIQNQKKSMKTKFKDFTENKTFENQNSKDCEKEDKEFELHYCSHCLQMTNHINNVCQKHKSSK